MAEQPGAGRLDPETLAAYIDGLLPPEERARVEAEIAADPETYEWVVNAVNAVEDASIVVPDEARRETGAATDHGRTAASGGGGSKTLPFKPRRAVVAAVGTLLVTAAALLIVVRTQPAWWQNAWGPSVDPRFAKLVEAVGEERYIEARLTGGFKYGPLREVTRGPGDLTSQNLQLLAAAGELQKAATAAASLDELHAWGVAQTLLSQPEGAIAALLQAEQRADGRVSAQLLSDLAAAYLLRAELRGATEDLPKALVAAERAVAADTQLPEGHFNLALVLERMGLRPAAVEAWRKYAELEVDVQWQQEARRHEQALQRGQPVSALEPQRSTVEQAIVAWANAARRRDPAAAQLLKDAVQSAEALRAAGEALPADALTGVVAAVEGRNTAQVEAAAEGFALYAEAWRTLRSQGPQAASRLMTSAAERFTQAGNPYSLWAVQFTSIAARIANEIERAVTVLDGSAVPPAPWAHARGRFFWTRGVGHEFAGHLNAARSDLREAVSAFRAGRETDELASALVLLAEIELSLGNARDVWALVVEALDVHDRSNTNAWRALLYGASFALLHDAPVVALRFEDAALAALESVGDVQNRADALRQRAETLLRLERPQQALESLALATSVASEIADDDVREKALADAALVEGQAFEHLDPVRVESNLARALEYFSKNALTEQKALAYVTMARGRLRTGDRDGAAQAYRLALAAHEADEAGLASLTLVDRLFAFPATYRTATEFAALVRDTPGGAAEALETLERVRGRAVREVRAMSRRHVSLSTLRRQLPRDTCVLYFARLEDRLGAWVLSRAGVERVPGDLPLRDIRNDVRELDALVEADASLAGAAPVLHRLWRQLVAPANVSGTTRVVVVPDDVLWNVPFPALLDGDGIPLVASHAVSIAPSVALAVGLSTTLDTFTPASVRAVGDAHDPQSTGLPRLPGADAEAAAVARLYPRGVIATGSSAAREALLDVDTDVLHFAGHAIAEPRTPWYSRLLVSPEDGGQGGGVVTAAEIATTGRLQAKVVVLAACESAVGTPAGGEGVASLAMMYLAAGASTVVAPLWKVSDADSRLLISFHRQLLNTRDPSAALRAAQQQMITEMPDVPLRKWAAYTALGGLRR